MYADTYASYVTAGIRQLEGRVGSFLKGQEFDGLYLTPAQYKSDCAVQIKREFLEQERCTTEIICSPSGKRGFIAVHEEWFGTNST